MNKFVKQALVLTASVALFAPTVYLTHSHQEIVVNAAAKHHHHKRVHKARRHRARKHHARKRRARRHVRRRRHRRVYHLSYEDQMKQDVDNYNNGLDWTDYTLGNGNEGNYTSDYKGMVDSINDLINNTDNDTDEYDTSNHRDYAVTIYNVFKGRFSRNENRTLSNMRHSISGEVNDNNSDTIQNNTIVFLHELAHAISTLER